MLHFLQRGMFSQPLPSVVFAFLKYLHQQLGIPVVVAHHLVFQYRKRKTKHLLVLEKTLEMVHIYKQVNERDLTAQFCRFMWFVWSTETLQMHFQRWSRDERFAPNSRNRQVKKKKKANEDGSWPLPSCNSWELAPKMLFTIAVILHSLPGCLFIFLTSVSFTALLNIRIWLRSVYMCLSYTQKLFIYFISTGCPNFFSFL